jgi:hypothetical protein
MELLKAAMLGIASLTPTYVIRSGGHRRRALGMANGPSASPGNGLYAGKKRTPPCDGVLWFSDDSLVERMGIEPTTSALRTQRSPS